MLADKHGDLSFKSLSVWIFLSRTFPLTSQVQKYGWETRSLEAFHGVHFPRHIPDKVNQRSVVCIHFKTVKLASSNYTSDPIRCTRGLGSITSILSHRAIILQIYTRSIPSSEKRQRRRQGHCMGVFSSAHHSRRWATPWLCHTSSFYVPTVTMAAGQPPKTGSGRPGWSSKVLLKCFYIWGAEATT